jgi:hypothetical protein
MFIVGGVPALGRTDRSNWPKLAEAIKISAPDNIIFFI